MAGTGFPFTRIRTYLWRTLLALLAAALLFAAYGMWWVADFYGGLKFQTDPVRYQQAEFLESDIIARRWMVLALEIQKEENFSPPEAARFFAYITSAYDDVLSATGDPQQASAAAVIMIADIAPEHRTKAGTLQNKLFGTRVTMTKPVIEVSVRYRERMKSDGFSLVWSPEDIPQGPEYWYPRAEVWYRRDFMENPALKRFSSLFGYIDTGARSGDWKPWILNDFDVTVPPPAPRRSLADSADVQKSIAATQSRTQADIPSVTLWHGMTEVTRTEVRTNITTAGVWQNVLFVEKGDKLSEAEYSRAQKILAQTIADAYISAWREKYTYYTPRPSMRIGELDGILADPPTPAYVSGTSVVSAASASVLSALFPEARALWRAGAHDAQESRLLAGVQFDSAGVIGSQLGEILGAEVIRREGLGTPPQAPNFARPAIWEDLVAVSFLKVRTSIGDLSLQKIWEHVQGWRSSIRFADYARQANILVSVSDSFAWGDYDNDGLLDLIVGGNAYHNQGDGSFADVTETLGLSEKLASNPVFIDFDNDGCEDLLLQPSTLGVYATYRGNCAGKFVPTGHTINTTSRLPSFAFADYDNDGLVDVYSGGYQIPTFIQIPESSKNVLLEERSILWKNMGGGRFVDVSRQTGVDSIANCEKLFPPEHYRAAVSKETYQALWIDYNNDSLLDLFIATDLWISPLYRNNGDGTFTDVTAEALICKIGTGMGVSASDVDGNGFFDIYVTNTGTNYLWMNQGDGTFKEQSEQHGVNNLSQGWGTQFADYDNDGDQDLYVTNGVLGSITAEAVPMNDTVNWSPLDELYENNGNGYFYPIAGYAGIAGPYNKHPSAAIDYNNDGLLDMYVGARGHPDGIYNSLYRNISKTENHWLSLKLVGIESNRAGIGARITVVAGGKTMERFLFRGSSFLTQESPWPHFGLGKATKADTITIRWPSGIVQTLHDVPADQFVTVTEPEK